MAPTLRSNTTPIGRSGIESTPTKSPRKVPHCTKCQRPRAGHPRQGCPYTQSPRYAVQPNNQDLSASMDSLALSPRKTKLNERRHLPAHDITLASLSTESSDILNRLIHREKTYEDFTLADGNVGVGPTPELQQSHSASSRPPFKEGRIMPGTLAAPSFLTATGLPSETPHPSQFDSKASIAMTPPTDAPPPLARSMSVEERASFLDGLSELSRGPPATVYSIHVLELQHIAESAMKLGFHTGVVLPKTGPREEGLLVLGRDLRAVEDLAARLSQESPKQSGVRALAGGVVAGAVATFTGLALA